MGVDFLELDIHISKDGEAIIVHDKTMEKSTNILDVADEWRHKAYYDRFYFPDFTMAELR